MKLCLIKKDNKLIPFYGSDIEQYGKLKNNIVYMAEFKKPRNYAHHKKIFALAKCVIENAPEGSVWHGKDPLALIKAIELQLGYVEEIIKLDGEVVLVPESISFESWDQIKFQEFYEKALPLMAGIIGITADELEEGSVEFM